MPYSIKPSNKVIEQMKNLSKESAKLLGKKIQLIYMNPFRNKRLKGLNCPVFRIRFQDRRKEKRLVYLIEKDQIIILCILDRDKEYKDLKKYLKDLK